MHYRRLGNSGLKVSSIGLGTNQFGGKVNLDQTKNIIAAALEAGVNLLDTANVYTNGKSEEFIGEALKSQRHRAVIATKVRWKVGDFPNDQGASRLHIIAGVHASLRRLKTDYIDLYQIHAWDEDTPIEETMCALDDLVREGKVRYIGASNFSAWQLTWANALAIKNGWTKFISVQPHYHLFERSIENELIPACEYFGIGILPYFPLAGGFLTGKYQEGQTIPPGSRGETSTYVQKYFSAGYYSKLDQLKTFAQERGYTVNELAHAWLLAQPMVSSVISGATQVKQVLANTVASEWELSPEDIQELNRILE